MYDLCKNIHIGSVYINKITSKAIFTTLAADVKTNWKMRFREGEEEDEEDADYESGESDTD